MAVSIDASAAPPRELPPTPPEPLLAEVPAFASPDWLPEDSGWPLLAELRAEHVRLLDQLRAVREEEASLQHRFAEQDEAREAAEVAGFRDGAEPDLPELTPAEDRRAALDAAG